MGKKAAAKAKKQKKSTFAPSASFPGAAAASNKVRIVVDARFFSLFLSLSAKFAFLSAAGAFFALSTAGLNARACARHPMRTKR